MAELKFKYGTEAQILALTPASEKWIDRAFYYPNDKSYFFQALDGIMKKYGAGGVGISGIGITLNDLVIGGVKTLIEESDTLNIPENYDYNTYKLNVNGVINVEGQINIM